MAQIAQQIINKTVTSKVVYNRSIYTRGLNIQGQLGINNNFNGLLDFIPNPKLQNLNIKQIAVDHSQNFAVYNDNTLLFWGWPLCTRTTYRFIEHYEKMGRFLRGIQRFTPFFKPGTKEPIIETAFKKNIVDISLGCGFIAILDENQKVFSWGDNYAGQLGTGDDIHRDIPIIVSSLADQTIVQMATGFQHCLYLNNQGEVFGIGKNNRFQLGRVKNENSQNQEIFDKYQGAIKLNYFEEKIVQIAAGKFHSLFLGESGRLWAVGYNKYGQIGVSNSLFMHAEEPVEVFTDGLKIKNISAGWHHNILQGEDGKLYGIGARLNGQLDGNNFDGREEQCSIIEIQLPTDKQIVKFKAQNLRNYAITEDNQVWFWGGYFYNGYKKLCIDGFNLLNEEKGLEDKHIIDMGLGFAHDTVLVENQQPTTV